MKRTAIVILVLLLLCGCTQAPEEAEHTFFAMDTVMTLRAYGVDEGALEDAEETVRQLEAKLSVTDPGSEIYRLNTYGSSTLSPDTAWLVSRALEMCERSGGVLDITIYPVLKAWGFTGDTYQIPDADTLSRLLAGVDYRQVQLEGAAASLPDGMMADLGSVAKGYTGDILTEQLRAAGASSACLNLGGNVQTIGAKPDGSPWQVGIQDPTGSEVAGAVALTNQAAITSGAYQRFFTDDAGNTYGHILDPRTGAPARTDLLSVTIVGDSGLTCDALSTTLYIMGLDAGIAFWRESRDFDAVFITADGDVVITEGLADRFTLLQENRTLLVVK